MIAEIYHKFSTNSEDVLTGCFFGTMRYLPFSRGLNKIFKHYAVSEDPQVSHILSGLSDEEFDFEFWKRSENGNVELVGAYVNLEYTLSNGKKVKFLDDEKTYLGNQLESEFGGERCFGILANMDFILISTYGTHGEDPELVLYKKR